MSENANGAPPPSSDTQKGALKKLGKRRRASRPRFGTRFRNYLLTGLIIVGPVGITLYIGWWFINWVDSWVKPFVPDVYNPETYLPFSLPGLGLLFALFGLAFIGALAANLLGRTIISYGELFLGRMPVVRNLYSALKQIFETVLSQSNTSFQDVGVIEYPRPGIYAIVFISTETKGELAAIGESKGERYLSVFLPTTPNPTSGFLLFVPKEDVTLLDMSVEEGAKMVISAGLVVPDYQATLAAKAAEAKRLEGQPVDSAAEQGAETRLPHKDAAE
ncbi:MAG: DUF502 domain-containing protein [Pseudomonadota bacterium]